MRAPSHPRQPERLEALRELAILDTPREPRYDKIAELAAEACQAPIAVINLIDEHRQWFKAEVGLGVRETPLETSICSHVILEPGLTVIRDTLADPRMADNPLCFADPHLRFYAGAILTDRGLPIGTLCVLDYQPRDLTEQQRRMLTGLAEQVMIQISLGQKLHYAETLQQEVDHRVRNSLGQIQSLLSLQARHAASDDLKHALEAARDRVAAVATVHDHLHRTGSLLDVDLKLFTEQLVDSVRSQADDQISISVDMPSVRLPAREASNVGIVINELLTNSLRHAFNLGERGTIDVVGRLLGRQLRVSISDTGKGLPPDFDPASTSGLGTRLAHMIAKQFAGELNWSSSEYGTKFEFVVPL